jgi:hypothetical protein
MKTALTFILAWIASLALVFSSIPAKGTDASRFEASLRKLHEEIFYWHESMYILGMETWEPDWHWYMSLSHDIDQFRQELDRLPDSPCAAQARAAVIQDGPWISATIGDMAGVEQRWNDVMEHLPLSCDEF